MPQAMDPKLLQILNNRDDKYPHALAERFPHILKKIVALWDKPGSIDAYFAELMVDDRGGRAGFPPEVASDIFYLSTLVPKPELDKDNPWGHIPEIVEQEIKRHNIQYSPQGFIKASENGMREVVSLFLNSGMSADTCDERQWTPLMYAALNGNEEIVTMLLKKRADVNHKDNAGYSALHWAAFNGHAKVVQLLLSNRADANACSNHGWTALLQAATRGHLSVCCMLVEKGADVNAATNDGWTSLHKAAANGHLPVVVLLLSKGANIYAKYVDGTTPLDLAIKNKHEEVAAKLSAAINPS